MARSAGDALACAAAGTPAAAGAAVRHFGAPDVRSPPAAMPATSVAASPIPRMGSSCQAFPIPRVFMRLFRPGGAGYRLPETRIAFGRTVVWSCRWGAANDLTLGIDTGRVHRAVERLRLFDHSGSPENPRPGGEREAVHAVPSRDR